MSRRRGTRTPSELEHCVLGVLALFGPCTAYRVRNYVSGSLSSYWSASAGAIYPLLARLSDEGWIRASETPFGTRTRRAFALSAAGRRVLRDWLRTPVDEALAAHTHDPVRTRIFFLDVIGADAADEHLASAIAGTERVLAQHQRELEERDDLAFMDRLGRRGAILQLEARVAWLREVQRELGSR